MYGALTSGFTFLQVNHHSRLRDTLKLFEAHGKTSVLIKFVELHIIQLVELLALPDTQLQAFFTLQWILPRYRHSSAVFHAVCSCAPRILMVLEVLVMSRGQHNSSGGISRACKIGFCKLLRALMLEFPGFPELYDPVLAVMGRDADWKESELRMMLKAITPWPSTTRDYPEIIASASSSSNQRCPELRVGLRNLGNTCFANSVIQALFSVLPFRKALLSIPWNSTPNTGAAEQQIREVSWSSSGLSG